MYKHASPEIALYFPHQYIPASDRADDIPRECQRPIRPFRPAQMSCSISHPQPSAIGELAQTQGESQAVKDFGKLLVADHGAHKQELGALAQAAGIKTTDDLSDDAKANLEKLEALRGHAFDREFKTMMVEDHTKDIGKYEKQASSGDADTAALAQKTLPTLRKHLEAAKSL